MAQNVYISYLLDEVFAYIPGVSSRPMFGGYGIYKDGLIFAIVVSDTLYFKVGDTNKKDFEKYGSEPFIYHRKDGKTSEMGYWELPEEIIEDKTLLLQWVQASLNAHKKK